MPRRVVRFAPLPAALLCSCGEPAYYPDLLTQAELPDTGFVPVEQVCGVSGTESTQTVEIRSAIDRPLRIVVVDAACIETTLTTLQPSEFRAFVVSDLDALGAYLAVGVDDLRVAARAPLPGLSSSTWVVP